MRPVAGLSGCWNQGRNAVQFRWDPRSLVDERYVYIFELTRTPKGLQLTNNSMIHDIMSFSSSNQQLFIRPLNVTNEISVHTFWVFLTADHIGGQETQLLRACLGSPERKAYFAEVVTGKANVTYAIKFSRVGEGQLATITVKSDRSILPHVLGYSFRCGNSKIRHSFPGTIPKGKQDYPAIVVPRDSDLKVIPVDNRFAENLSVTRKLFII